MVFDDRFGQSPAQARFAIDEARESPWVAESLAAEIASGFGQRDESPFSILAREENTGLIGGVNGVSHWRWLYIRHFFVVSAWRRRGLGRRLMAQAEALGQARGCGGIYLDTFDKNAAAFYQRCGFVRCGAIDNFPPGAARIYMKKDLHAG